MMKCDKSTDEAERYVSGVQSEAEQAAFEEHFFACEDCLLRVQALQDAVAVLSAERAGANTGPIPFPGPRVRTLPVKWMALAAMIVVSVLVWRLPREAARPAVEVASSPPQPAITVAPKPAASEPQPPGAPAPNFVQESRRLKEEETRFAAASAITPPPYVSLTTRAESDAVAKNFEAAMEHYSANRHGRAAEGLRDVVQDAPDLAHAQFFLGISELMIKDDSRARQSLQQAANTNIQPYADEAHFYLAKAAFRLGDTAGASREARIAVDREAGPPGEAARFLAFLEKIQQ